VVAGWAFAVPRLLANVKSSVIIIELEAREHPCSRLPLVVREEE
jgi:hypothetical protein